MRKNDNKTKKSVDILFTGLVRMPEMFKKSILDLLAMRKEGLVNKILFSTWLGEVEKYPDIHKFLDKHDIRIIRSKEPSPRGTKNSPTIWCQMKALEIGLKNIEKNRFALKTRTDVYINPLFLRKLFKEKESLLKITKDLPKGNLFRYKVWIFYYEIKTPFHMGEECFFGDRDDLKNLVNYESSYDIDYKIGGGISHIRRYINPFLRDYPIFFEYLKKYNKDTLSKSIVEKEKILLKYDLYRKCFPHKYGLRAMLRRIPLLRDINKHNKF